MASWHQYLILGTTEGELTMMDPAHWTAENTFYAVLKDKTAIKFLQVNHEGLALSACDGGYNQFVIELESRKVLYTNEEPRASPITLEWF